MMAAQLQKASGASSGSSSEATALGAAAAAPAVPPATAPVTEATPLRNRAGESNSPYVRAQADTPVNWQLFGQDALDRAKQENKPIFLHIGFLACHYCHLTTQDSFSNPSIASILNEFFIPIVVDREERPDIDAVYWNYLQLVNSSAGWPINVFLTPDLEPVFGGSYWPGPGAEASGRDKQSGSEDGEEELIGFLGVLEKLRQSWTEREAQCRTEAQETVVQLRKFAAEGTLGPRGLLKPGESKTNETNLSSELDLDIDQLDEAYSTLRQTFDPVNGGFGVVPKFVTPAKYSFLLQLGSFPSVVQDIVGDTEVSSIVQMALFTLRKLRNSALHDHLSGGFGRASHTINWSLPHFEKLIPDNGLLLSLYLDAWLYTLRAPKSDLSSSSAAETQPEFLDVIYSLADYLSSAPVRLEGGGFASSESADSYYRKGDRHVREGAYYVWTRREFDTVVGGGNGHNDMDARVAAAYWNVLQDGNVDRDNDPFDEFINQNALYVSKDTAELARQFNIPRENVERITTEARTKLAAHREKERVRPALDDKVVVAGNGLVIGSLARTGAALKFGGHSAEKGDKYITAARDAAKFIQENLWVAKDKKLYRVFVNGKREDVHAFAEDYAYLIEGLLELYEATGEAEWLEWADELQEQQIKLFYDSPGVPSTQTHSSSGGFYRTQESGNDVDLLRLKDGMDTTLPATNAVAASNLFRLGSILNDNTYTHLARETIHAFEVEMLQHSWLFPGLLSQIVAARLGGPQVAALAAGPSASDPVVAEYFQRPRAGLRSLVYVDGGAGNGKETTAAAWLLGRNPSLVDLPTKEAAAEDGGSSYVLKDGKWEKASPVDLVVNVEASS
ncbi:uncharacterized protein SPSK_02232 [Sporothrix schenckii 1099-18]|uniref:Spermatogenesis-associated protein 20-like TRX domain-containing protein n=1 Tax=Sporothrix schenckii 1099-18 TaxID=1397361 RepID=A0A0F2M8U1_SPOSC|nr:uncharacterized protein SPSK_02232 [Sporothrix schenckii 1099-18]KJR86118.1 hypothetical protein SPSK_02232 [Sporothrix schenckii 1099-18]